MKGVYIRDPDPTTPYLSMDKTSVGSGVKVDIQGGSFSRVELFDLNRRRKKPRC